MKILSGPSQKSMSVPFIDADEPYRQCSLCVHDNIADPDIEFDDNGVCNYYYYYKQAEARDLQRGAVGEVQLASTAARISEAGRGLPYDCVVGLSGGVDSTYVLLAAKRLGLRPLAVHLDNGWNSEIAVKNIENAVKRLGVDLYTHVIDWEEFRSLQVAYLKASVVDIEVLTDHAILAILFRQAVDKKVKYILVGCNAQTENILPWSWVHPKGDHVNIQAIHRAYGQVPLKTFPLLDAKMKRLNARTRVVSYVSILNMMEYNKSKVKQEIQQELGWTDYGGKHYESVWTRFYQGYILPRKFRIDKRKAHLSSLIFDGQLSKDEALVELQQPIYDPEVFSIDYDFVMKKLGMRKEEFERLMDAPRRSHYEFDYEMPLHRRYPFLGPLYRFYRTVFPLR